MSVDERDDVDTVEELRDRARQERAEESDAIEPDDLDVWIDDRRVQDVRVRDDRRDAVADRARETTAAEADAIRRDDVDVEVGTRGVERVDVDEEAVAGRQADELLGSPEVLIEGTRGESAAEVIAREQDVGQRLVIERALERSGSDLNPRFDDPAAIVRDLDPDEVEATLDEFGEGDQTRPFDRPFGQDGTIADAVRDADETAAERRALAEEDPQAFVEEADVESAQRVSEFTTREQQVGRAQFVAERDARQEVADEFDGVDITDVSVEDGRARLDDDVGDEIARERAREELADELDADPDEVELERDGDEFVGVVETDRRVTGDVDAAEAQAEQILSEAEPETIGDPDVAQAQADQIISGADVERQREIDPDTPTRSVAAADPAVARLDAVADAESVGSDDDLPRLADVTGQGDSEFRRDGRLRSVSEDVAERGGEVVGGAFGAFGEFIGAEGTDQRVVQQTGQSIGALPGALGLVTADAVDATLSVGAAGRDEGVSGAADQFTDVQTDAVDFAVGGVDRATDIDRERRASGEGALVEFDTAGSREVETGAGLAAGALLLGASGPVSAGARTAAGRAPSPDGSVGSFRQFAADDRAQLQAPRGQRRDRGDDDGAVSSGWDEDVAADLRQDSLTQAQDQLRPQARREQRVQRDLVDEPGAGDPVGRDGSGPTFDPDAPQPAGPSRFAQERQAGQQVPRGFGDIDRAVNVPITDLRTTVSPQAPGATTRFASQGGVAAAAATSGPRQPTPGGMLVDDRGEIRGQDRLTGVDEDLAVGSASVAAGGFLGLQETRPETTEAVTGVGIDTDTGTDVTTATDTAFGFAQDTPPATDTAQDIGTRPDSRTDTRTGQRTATDQRTGQTTPSGRARSVTDLIPGLRTRPPQTRTRTRPINRPGRPTPRPRPPNFEFGGPEQRETDDDLLGLGRAGERAAAGGPVVGFGAETFDALARGAFQDRELPDEIGDGVSPELPTAALVDPDDDEEEGVGFVGDLFGLDVGGGGGRRDP